MVQAFDRKGLLLKAGLTRLENDLAASPDAEETGDEPLGNSDAAGEEGGDASRQIATAMPEAGTDESAEDRDT